MSQNADFAKLDYQRHYAFWHKDNDLAHREHMKRSYRAMVAPYLDLAALAKGPALDLGCGMGFAMEMMKDFGFMPVLGIDRDVRQIEICRKRGLQVIQTDDLAKAREAMPVKFKLITAFDFLEHMPAMDALNLLKRVYEMLEEGGTFLCTVPNANSAFAARWRYIDFTHFESYTEHSLDFLLYNAGFKSIGIHDADPMFLKRPPRVFIRPAAFWVWVNRLLARGFRRWQSIAELGEEGKTIPLSLNLLGIARK